MSIWDYLGEFLLFRWLFGKLNRNHSAHNTDSADTIDYTHIHSKEDVTFRTIDQQTRLPVPYIAVPISTMMMMRLMITTLPTAMTVRSMILSMTATIAIMAIPSHTMNSTKSRMTTT